MKRHIYTLLLITIAFISSNKTFAQIDYWSYDAIKNLTNAAYINAIGETGEKRLNIIAWNNNTKLHQWPTDKFRQFYSWGDLRDFSIISNTVNTTLYYNGSNYNMSGFDPLHHKNNNVSYLVTEFWKTSRVNNNLLREADYNTGFIGTGIVNRGASINPSELTSNTGYSFQVSKMITKMTTGAQRDGNEQYSNSYMTLFRYDAGEYVERIYNVKIDRPFWDSNMPTQLCQSSSEYTINTKFNTIDLNGWSFACPSNPDFLIQSGTSLKLDRSVNAGSYEVIASKNYTNTSSAVEIKFTIQIVGSPTTTLSGLTQQFCKDILTLDLSTFFGSSTTQYADIQECDGVSGATVCRNTAANESLALQGFGRRSEARIHYSDGTTNTIYYDPRDPIHEVSAPDVEIEQIYVYTRSDIDDGNGGTCWSNASAYIQTVEPTGTYSAGDNLITCINDDKIYLERTNESPQGGTFSGEGVELDATGYYLDITQIEESGNHSVYYNSDALGCASVSEKRVTVYDVPSFELGSDFTYCYGNNSEQIVPLNSNATSVSYSFLIGDNSAITDDNVHLPTLGSGDYILEALAEKVIGPTLTCSITDTAFYSVSDGLLTPDVSNERFCEVKDIQLKVLSAQPGLQYEWYEVVNGDNVFIESTSQLEVNQSSLNSLSEGQSKNYKVKTVDSGSSGCFSEFKDVSITRKISPTVRLDTVFTYCEGETGLRLLGGATVNGNSHSSGLWTGLNVGGTGQIDLAQFVSVGLYDVTYTYTDVDLCSVSASSIIDIKGSPIVDAGFSQELCGNTGVMEINQVGVVDASLPQLWYFPNSEPGLQTAIKYIGDRYYIDTEHPNLLARNEPYSLAMEVTNASGCIAVEYKEVYLLPSPERPTVINNSRCGTGNIALTVNNPTATSIYKWYDATDTTTLLKEATAFNKNALESFTMAIQEVTDKGCVSEFETAEAIVYELPNLDIGEDLLLCRNITSYDLNDDVATDYRGGVWELLANQPIQGYLLNEKDFWARQSIGSLDEASWGVKYTFTDTTGCVVTKGKLVSVISNIAGNLFIEDEIEICETDPVFVITDYVNNIEGATYTSPGIVGSNIYVPSNITIFQGLGYGSDLIELSLDSNGCTYQDYLNVKVLASPEEPEVLGNNGDCEGQFITLNVNSPDALVDYVWSYTNNEGNIITETGEETINVAVLPNGNTVYVNAEGLNGCRLSQDVRFDIENLTPKGILTVNGSELNDEVFLGEATRFNFLQNSGGSIDEFNWVFDDGFVSEEEEIIRYFYTSDSVSVTLELESETGCDALIYFEESLPMIGSAADIPVSPTSADKNNSLTGLLSVGVYPNVTDDYVHLMIDNGNIYSVQVYNLLGVLIDEFSIEGHYSYDVSKLQSGQYLIKVTDSLGGSTVEKIIKY